MAMINPMTAPGPGGTLDLNQTNCEMVQCGAISSQEANSIIVTPPLSMNPNGASMPFASACSEMGWQGPNGGRNCSDSICQPLKQQIYAAGPSGQGLECCVADGGSYQADGSCRPSVPTPAPMPSATQSTMPSITSTAQVVAPQPPPVLTPTNMQQRMPTIVNPAPMNVAPVCTDDFATWVSNNTMLAVGGLAVLAFMLLGGKEAR